MPTLLTKEIIAKERGTRLRVCRCYTGLNIKDFCEKHDFSVITFARWEKGNKVSLNKKNVDRVCHALLKEGIIVTSEWLLDGRGIAPKEKTGQPLLQSNEIDSSAALSGLLMFSEMEVFQQCTQNAITTVIDNSDMIPFYDVGDCVGGIKLAPSEYDLAHKKICLVKPSWSNKIILRNVQFDGNRIILTATNGEDIILEEKSIPEILAPVVFYRKIPEWAHKRI